MASTNEPSPEERKRIIDEQDDIALMHYPSMWSCYPILPLKRYVDDSLELGILTDSDECFVIKGNAFMQLHVDGTFGHDNKVLRYGSPRDIYDDGWRVD